MKASARLTGILLTVSCAISAQTDTAEPETKVKTFPWLSHVIGSCWRSELGSPEVQDRQCFRPQFDRVVRVDQQIDQASGETKSTLRADSLYVWDPRTRKVRHVFWASDGSFETASGWIECDALILFLDRETGPDGKASLRTVLRKTGADQYTASREQLDGDRWRQQFAFLYQRDGVAPTIP